jgi:hypothetical protein
MTLAEQLTSVQTAISAIESGGQEVTVNNRTYRRANLQELYDREERLLTRIARESGGGGTRTVAEF